MVLIERFPLRYYKGSYEVTTIEPSQGRNGSRGF